MNIDYMQNGNVISLNPVRSQIQFPAIGRVESYWEGLRDTRMMPTRAEVDPRGIADVLEYAFILEKLAPGLARIRLAGMHLNELMGMEVRGMPITALFLPEARRELQRVTEEVMRGPAAVRLSLGSDVGYTRPPIEGRMILLPLRDEEGQVARLLGALQTRGEIGRGPRRFSIRDIETKALTGEEPMPMPAAPAPARAGFGLPGFAERARPFAPKSQALAERLRRLGDNSEAPAAAPKAPAPAHDRERGPGLRLVYDADGIDL